MNTRPVSMLLGTGLALVTVGAIASPARAFVITNTSASWDNITLTGGGLVGSDGVAANATNRVEFLDIGSQSQVRWGDAAYGTEVVTQTAAHWSEYHGYGYGGSALYGTYTDTFGQQRTGFYNQGSDTIYTYENKSGLGYEGVSNLNLGVGEIFNIGTLTHFNQGVWSNDFIGTSAEMSLALDFGDIGIGSQNFDFTMSIDETANSQAVCPYQTDAGKGCSDQITWDFAINDTSAFDYEGEAYTLELVGFADMLATSGALNHSNLANDFISQEQADNSASLFARLVKVDTNKDIPEPATLLGLAGFGLYLTSSRKKKQGSKLLAPV